MTHARSVSGRLPGGEAAVTVHYTDEAIVAVDTAPTESPESLPLLTAGLIDLQVNGYAGLDINSAYVSAETVAELSDRLARIGVTSWAPTVITADEARILHALHQIDLARSTDPLVRAAVPMVHVEGPFISDRDGARGVHDPASIRPLDADEVERWAAHGPIGLVTVSPHTDDAPDHIARIRALGIEVAIGHTHASPEQIRRAVDAGARYSTHLGNGIPPMLPRHPNPIWTQLADDRLTTGIIADGHHLPAEVLEVMLRAKTPARAFLVSDLTAIGGLAPGRYETPVGGQVELEESGRLSYVGTEMLAGAASTLVDGVRTVATGTTFSLADAVGLATTVPGSIVAGRRPGLGRLSIGSPPDLVLWEADGDNLGESVTVVQSGRMVS
ncbi:N-acetylglucosamine-6-phosphate deacetylase [Phytoactinopolyspora halotolerans]|uniref:Amidohydrolase family protein n=1 Tax=Phytoactinopolyspora halotolerans TaxID=1981512 RepID=A0A6L9S782_9ACTN|nr:amidohydrolase family protein [Phytoactinopolyspora halotolerans]NEE00418.1 amidohydrolase family protein [Phytoactinopolyspora halotolerans]